MNESVVHLIECRPRRTHANDGAEGLRLIQPYSMLTIIYDICTRNCYCRNRLIYMTVIDSGKKKFLVDQELNTEIGDRTN